MNSRWNMIITVTLVALSASLVFAEDITTSSGKVYKHARVDRVEPDGIVIKFAGGVVKIPFEELSKEWQARYDYDPEAAQKFRNQNAAVVDALSAGWSANGATSKTEQEVELQLRQIRIYAFIKPGHNGGPAADFHRRQISFHVPRAFRPHPRRRLNDVLETSVPPWRDHKLLQAHTPRQEGTRSLRLILRKQRNEVSRVGFNSTRLRSKYLERQRLRIEPLRS